MAARLLVDGEKRRMVLGAYLEMSLQEARDERGRLRKLIARKVDPVVARKQQEAQRKFDSAATFEVAARAWLAERVPMWSGTYARTTTRVFENHLFPHWGALPINAITKPMVAQRIKAIEKAGTVETAHRAKRFAHEIFAYAEGLGHEIRNPADVKAVLQPVVSTPFPAVTDIEKLRRMLMTIEKAPAHPVTRLCSRLIALTAMRPGVVQTLPWKELEGLDESEPISLIAAARMKLRKQRKRLQAYYHLAPLVRQAVEVIQVLRVLSGTGPLVFPNTRSPHKAISDNTVSKLYRENGFRM